MEKIEQQYNELVNELAKTAYLWVNEKGYNYTKSDAVNRAIDDEFIYLQDECLVMCYAYMEKVFTWGDEIKWDEISAMLYDDVLTQLTHIINE